MAPISWETAELLGLPVVLYDKFLGYVEAKFKFVHTECGSICVGSEGCNLSGIHIRWLKHLVRAGVAVIFVDLEALEKGNESC